MTMTMIMMFINVLQKKTNNSVDYSDFLKVLSFQFYYFVLYCLI